MLCCCFYIKSVFAGTFAGDSLNNLKTLIGSTPPLSHSLCLSPGSHASNKMFARFAGSVMSLSHLPAQHSHVNKCLWAAQCRGRQWDNAGALEKENSCGTSGTGVCWTPRAPHMVATRRAGWLLHRFSLKFAINAASLLHFWAEK